MTLLSKIKEIWKPQHVPNLKELIIGNAALFDLDPKLVACIIYQESGGDENAYRVEEGFYDRYLKNKKAKELSGYVPNFPPTLISEKRARAVSYGSMQIMGETARMMGYKGRWLPNVKKSEDNIYIGCKYLRYLSDLPATKKISGGKEKLRYILTRWNGSSEYPDIIFDHLANQRWKEILID